MPRKIVISIGAALFASIISGCLLLTFCFALYRLR